MDLADLADLAFPAASAAAHLVLPAEWEAALRLRAEDYRRERAPEMACAGCSYAAARTASSIH